MDCPKCGQPDVTVPACPRCGVVFARLQSARPRPAPPPPVESASSSSALLLGFMAAVLALVIASGLAYRALRKAPPMAVVLPAPATAPAITPTTHAFEPPPVPPAPVIAAPVPTNLQVEDDDIPESDRKLAMGLVARLNRRASLADVDVQAAEGLFARYPRAEPIHTLLESVLLNAATQEVAQRRSAPALAHLRRAISIRPENIRAHLVVLSVLLQDSDWAGAEAAARLALARDARNFDAWYGLGFALYRQDRNREAAEALKSALQITESSPARSLLDRIQKGMADERGMREQHLSHFNVRYDGETHEDVGREILRALERHYLTLAGTFDHQLSATVPVILFSRETYYDASGAPAWSGGQYDGLDGRIRIPIGGVTASLTPEMDGTLIHELTHAFISDRSRGLAPRDIQEGMAQYMEGKRVASLTNAQNLKILADGRAGGVLGFYLEALAFVEYLMATRGRGGMNDLLKAMGETRDLNEAFRQVHGRDYAATRQAWLERFKQQSGS